VRALPGCYATLAMSSTSTYREHGHGGAIAPADDKTVSINLVRTAAVTPRLFSYAHRG